MSTIFTLIFLFHFSSCLILPQDYKRASFSNQYSIGQGDNGKIISVLIENTEYAAKTASILKNNITEVSAILFTASQRTPLVVRPAFATIRKGKLITGMDKMQADASVIYYSDDKLTFDQRSALNEIKEETLVGILLGVAELHKIGISHEDLQMSNILLDRRGNVFISDFGIISFIKPVTTANLPSYKESELPFLENIILTSNFKDLLDYLKRNGKELKLNWEKIIECINFLSSNKKQVVWIADQLEKGVFDE